jgi:hypothetical protein
MSTGIKALIVLVVSVIFAEISGFWLITVGSLKFDRI